MICDPLKDMQVDAKSFDIARIASVYFDRSGTRAWTKAWFNGRKNGERAIEISREEAIKYRQDMVSLDDWLAHYYPKQMNACTTAIEQARRQILGF